MYACLAVTCHLHFWQNDRDFLRATVVTRGWNGYRNKSQHRKSTLEKKIFPPFQQGFEPATFQSRVRCSNHWAIPAPQWLVIWDLLYTLIELLPVLFQLLVRVTPPPPPPPPPFTVLYKISIDCCFLFQYYSWIDQWFAALFAGCILMMYNWVMYASVRLALLPRYVLCGNSHV